MDPQPTNSSVQPAKKPIPFTIIILAILFLFTLTSTLILAYQNIQLQKLIIELKNIPAPTSTPSPTDEESPTPTCVPRPSCLDEEPRCLIPETEDMCPPKPFSCPENGWVDCMPGIGAKPECTPTAMAWYRANCPDFKGGAY